MTTLVVTRRGLLRGLGFVVAGGVGGFFVARNSAAAKGGASPAAANGYGYSAPKATGRSQPGRRLAPVASIPVGGGIVLGGAHVVLTRDSSGAVHGFSAVCTHQGCTVSSVRDGVITCPCHGSRFNADTGAVEGGPAPAPLPSVHVTVSGGTVYAS